MDPSELPLLQDRLSLTDPSQLPTSRLQVEMLVLIYFTAALAYCTYGLRMYSRLSTKQIGLEDWLMTAATILSMGFMAANHLYLKYNYAGFPQSEMPHRVDGKAAFFSVWLTQLLYSPILGLVKSSTLVFLLRIAGHVRNIRLCIHVSRHGGVGSDDSNPHPIGSAAPLEPPLRLQFMIISKGNVLSEADRHRQWVNIINICLTVVSVLVCVLSTIPVDAYWDHSHPIQHQINHGAFIMTTSCLTIVTDLLVLSIPFWAFMRTQLPLATRLGICMIFMAGGLVTAFGIVRFCVLAEQYWEPPPGRFMNTWGPTYAATETNLAIITGCLPAMRPLLRKWFPNQFGNSSTEDTGASEQRRNYVGSRSGNDGSIRMQDFSHKRGNVRCGSNSTTESHERLFSSDGIRKTTDIHVSYSTPISTPITQNFDENGRKDTPRPADPALVV